MLGSAELPAAMAKHSRVLQSEEAQRNHFRCADGLGPDQQHHYSDLGHKSIMFGIEQVGYEDESRGQQMCA